MTVKDQVQTEDTIFLDIVVNNHKKERKNQCQDQDVAPGITNQKRGRQNEKEKQESGIVAALTGCHEQAPAQQQADPDIQCDSTVLDHLFPVTDQQRDRYTEEDEILQSAGTIRKSRTADQIEEKASKTDEQPDNQQKTESLSVFPFKINSEAFYFSGIKKLFDLFSSITVHYEFSILEPLRNSLYRLHRAFSRECTGYPCVMEGIPSVLL